MPSSEDMHATSAARPDKFLRIDPALPYSRPSIVLTTPESTQPILPSAGSQATYLAQHCAPLESELLHQVTLFKSYLRPIRNGPEFWNTLAKGLTNLLGAQYACVSKRLDSIESKTGMPSLDEEGSCILALAWYYNCGESKTGMYNDVKYTGYCAPCGLMQYNSTALVPCGLMNTFPVNPNQNAFVEPPDAYLGVPMFDGKGDNVGHLCLCWTEEGREKCPYTWTMMEFVLHVFVEMATQRFLENNDELVAFEKEDAIAEAAIQSATKDLSLLPTPAAEADKTSFLSTTSEQIPTMFLPFPAAIAANISHEIRTPLQGIIGLLEILYAQIDNTHTPSNITLPTPPVSDQAGNAPQSVFKSLIDGIQENSNRLMDFADKLGEYYSIAKEAVTGTSPVFNLNPAPLRKRKFSDETDEEIVWATGGAQRKFLKRRKLDSLPTTEVDDSSSTDHQSHSRSSKSMSDSAVSIRSTIRQVVKHVLTRHEVAAIWGGKKVGLMMLNPETRMRSIVLGEEEESLEIQWRVAEDVPRWLYCGKSGLQKAMSQLLVNAIKFTPKGQITLQVTREAVPSLTGNQLKEMAVFSIKDTGIGVEEQYHQYLARPFFQVDPSTTRSREGSGLGLMLAHRWATKMGGGLRLESSRTGEDDPSHGSEFSLRLPIAKNLPIPPRSDADSDDEGVVSTPTSGTPTPTGISPKRQKSILAAAANAYDSHLATLYPLKIMVAEDNEMLRRLMAQLLEKLGYQSSQVVLCNNGQEAVDYFRTRSPKEYDIDLILMDCWMPIMDGLDATKQILDLFPANQKRYPGVKPDIVAITADNLPDNLAKTENSGMRGYMVKPIKLNDLQRVVEECAEGNWVMKKSAT